MKKLILILTTAIVVSSCSCNYDYKYLILDNRGIDYYTNHYYQNEDGCIIFNNKPGENDSQVESIIICGNYTIKNLK